MPSSRIVCGLGSSSGLPLSSFDPPDSSLKRWIWAEIANARKLIRIQSADRDQDPAQPAAPLRWRLRRRRPRPAKPLAQAVEIGRAQPAQQARPRLVDLVVGAPPLLVGTPARRRVGTLGNITMPDARTARRTAPLSAVETIGVDLGGTKMLVGVVDSDQRVLHRCDRAVDRAERGRAARELERELSEAATARPGVVAAGLGIPCTIDHERGVAITAVNLPITDVPIRDLMRERVGLPVFIDNDANVAAIAEHRFGAARGSPQRRDADDRHRDRRRPDHRRRRSTAARPGAGAELGHMVVDLDGPRCQGNCPNHGCIEAFASGTALGREGRAAAERAPDSALGRALAAGEEINGHTVTDAALGRRRGGARGRWR